ncbi:FAD-dependent oxidoreductase [Undibacterium piscinae]|uniref:FAD-dependent oxidoreductase n=1 Tax=Undibacterium piscinae TaxID=2495591 RepID=A0A6M4A876_9BURK|nr:FAD-dependent oxidoreductase [Undibacterium piscinae]
MKPITIIGSGIAAYTVARELRKLDKVRPLLIITSDDGGFYSKPMLSNAFAQNKEPAQLMSQSAAQMAEQLNASILQHTTVTQIQTVAKTISTSAGEFEYDKLVIAVGAQPIRLPIAGNAAERVLSVNKLSDYTVLRQQINAHGAQARVTILGAGLIGCEFADDLAGAGHLVTLVDPNPLPMAALAPKPISIALQCALEQRGVQMQLGSTAASIATNETPASGSPALQVTLSTGSIIEADLVLSAVGLRPDLRLAQASGLATERGILVDTTGMSSAPDVYALGDCAQYSNPADGTRPVLPYIAPIMTAARAIARSLNGELTQIELKPAPVIVKTPSYPIALIAPPPQLAALGHWQHEQSGNITICRFFDAEQRMTGFAVAPQDAKLRAALLAEMSAAKPADLAA